MLHAVTLTPWLFTAPASPVPAWLGTKQPHLAVFFPVAFIFNVFPRTFPPCCSCRPSAWRVKCNTGNRKKCSGAHALRAGRRLLRGVPASGHEPKTHAEVGRAYQHCSHGQAGVQGGTQRRHATAEMPLHRKDPCGSRCCTERGRDGSRAGASEKSDECRGLWGPPASDLNSENHKAAAPCRAKFEVRVASFALGGLGQGNARSRLRPCTRLPVTPTGLTLVASMASCAPCRRGSPLQTTSMRRASWMGTSRFMSASRTFCATCAPASLHTLANARSRGMAREARTPAVTHAARWSPKASKCRRHVQARGARGRGKRSLRSRRTRK